MKRVMSGVFVVVGAVTVLALVGCAKPPQSEIEAVNTAIENAEIAEAGTYAPDQLEAAFEVQRKAMAEVEAQNARFALTRSYEKATTLLKDAGVAADAARAAAVGNREAAIAEANRAIKALNDQMATANEDIAALASCRRKPKGFVQDLELMHGRIEALSGQLAEVEAEIEAERYLNAIELSKATEPELAAVATDLASARSKLGC